MFSTIAEDCLQTRGDLDARHSRALGLYSEITKLLLAAEESIHKHLKDVESKQLILDMHLDNSSQHTPPSERFQSMFTAIQVCFLFELDDAIDFHTMLSRFNVRFIQIISLIIISAMIALRQSYYSRCDFLGYRF